MQIIIITCFFIGIIVCIMAIMNLLCFEYCGKNCFCIASNSRQSFPTSKTGRTSDALHVHSPSPIAPGDLISVGATRGEDKKRTRVHLVWNNILTDPSHVIWKIYVVFVQSIFFILISSIIKLWNKCLSNYDIIS